MAEPRAMPIASLSLDLDNQWSYMKTHGDSNWESYPSYLDWVVPRILEYLDNRDLKITFFIVGKDATVAGNRSAIRAIRDAGHEIGSHSFHHDPWLHLYSEDDLNTELQRAEDAIEGATGLCPTAFRGPGFSISPLALRILAERGYEYDATVFPNVLNPAARAYFFATSSLSKEEKEQRKELFGTWRDALRPVKPFHWQLDGGKLLEIPVTTMPVFKTPMHLSYIIYAAKFSKTAAMAYFRTALFMCRMTRTSPSILLHPLDFMGCDDLSELAFFPGMDMTLERKMGVVDSVMDAMAGHYRLVTVGEHASHVNGNLRTLELDYSGS